MHAIELGSEVEVYNRNKQKGRGKNGRKGKTGEDRKNTERERPNEGKYLREENPW